MTGREMIRGEDDGGDRMIGGEDDRRTNIYQQENRCILLTIHQHNVLFCNTEIQLDQENVL